MINTEKTVDQLDAFSWDNDEDWNPEDFFEEKPTEEAGKAPDQAAEPSDAEFLGSVEEEQESEEAEEAEEADTEVSEEPEEEELDIFTAAAKDLEQLGFFPKVEGKVDEGKFLETLESTIEEKIDTGIEQVIESWKKDLGETGTEFIKFTMNGGKPEDFFTQYSQDQLNFNVDTEWGQKQFLEYYYGKVMGHDEEDVESLIEAHMDGETMEKAAKKFYGKLKSEKDSKKSEFIQKQQELHEARQEAARQRIQQFKDAASKVDHILVRGEGGKELGKVAFTAAEKRALTNYITQNSVQTQNGKYMSEFMADLNKIYQEEPDKLMMLAKIMKSGFDMSDFVKQGVSEETKKVKSNLQRIKTKQKTKTQPRKDRPAWEYF